MWKKHINKAMKVHDANNNRYNKCASAERITCNQASVAIAVTGVVAARAVADFLGGTKKYLA